MPKVEHEAAKGKPCPECGRPSTDDHRPFCSARCRTVDLNRWLSGGYVIPGEPVGDGLSRAEAAGEIDEDDEPSRTPHGPSRRH